MCICLKDLSLRVSSAIATPPLLHIEIPLPPVAGDSTDRILGDLHFARFKTREVISYNKHGRRLCDATVLREASNFKDEASNDMIINQRGGRKKDEIQNGTKIKIEIRSVNRRRKSKSRGSNK
jgi:hypothetical protein